MRLRIYFEEYNCVLVLTTMLDTMLSVSYAFSSMHYLLIIFNVLPI